MTKQQESIYTKIAIGAGVYFFIVRPILQKIGIVKTPEERLVENQNNLPNNVNPFSPIFWKQGGAGTKILTSGAAKLYSEKIYNALGYFTDDEAAILGVFRSLKTQSQVSYLCDSFFQLYKVSLLDFLQKGKNQYNPASGLNSEELNTIIQIVNNLPKYK